MQWAILYKLHEVKDKTRRKMKVSRSVDGSRSGEVESPNQISVSYNIQTELHNIVVLGFP